MHQRPKLLIRCTFTYATKPKFWSWGFLTLHTPKTKKLYTLEKVLNVRPEDLSESKTDYSVYGILTLDDAYALFGERYSQLKMVFMF